MHPVARSVRRRGGIAATFELYADGHTRGGLASAVRAGVVTRARQGWYVSRDIPQALLRSVRVGGRATCITALEVQGFWTFPSAELHVAVPPNACRLREPQDARTRLTRDGVRVHWRCAGDGSSLMLGPMAALSDVLACQSVEVAAVLADSVLHLRPELLAPWRALLADAPEQFTVGLRHVDGVCESGTETLFFARMLRFRFPIRRQVLLGRMRVDFLIGDALVIEVDGAEYHVDPDRFEGDRRRDALLSRLGFRVHRYSYRQIVYAWPEVEAAVLAAVIRGDHHRA